MGAGSAGAGAAAGLAEGGADADAPEGEAHGEGGDTVYVEQSLAGVSFGGVGRALVDGVLYLDLDCGGIEICGGDLTLEGPALLHLDIEALTGKSRQSMFASIDVGKTYSISQGDWMEFFRAGI